MNLSTVCDTPSIELVKFKDPSMALKRELMVGKLKNKYSTNNFDDFATQSQ